MDNKKRAEKIVREISYGYADTQLRGVSLENVKWVESQLEEAIRHEFLKMWPNCAEEWTNRGFQKGFALAREKAAGIVKTEAKTWGDSVTSVTIWGLEERIQEMDVDK